MYIADMKKVEGVQHRATKIIMRVKRQTLLRKTFELKLVLNGM